jgi:hypothetical protein
MNLSSNELTIILIVLGLLILILFGVYVERRRKRSKALRNRFGTEYDRAVETHGSERKAEAKLAALEARVDKMKIRELGAAERERFLADWLTVQSRFVDHPKGAVTEADELVTSLLQARGYPLSSFEQRAADVSVDYPRVMDNYRTAQNIAVRQGRADASTEELRTAMVAYRAIFDELLGTTVPVVAASAA